MNLFDSITLRNNSFNNDTKLILNTYKDKLDQIANKLLKDTVVTELKYIDIIKCDEYPAVSSDLVSIHGLLETNVGQILYDSANDTQIIITEENKSAYLQYLKIIVSSKTFETDSVDNIVNTIKDIYKFEDKMDAAEFQTMDIPKIKH